MEHLLLYGTEGYRFDSFDSYSCISTTTSVRPNARPA